MLNRSETDENPYNICLTSADKLSQQFRRCTASGDATLFFKQQLPAITQQFFQGNIFMTIAVILQVIAVQEKEMVVCGLQLP